MKHTPIKVGFDLDGVLLYNPARVFRPVTLMVKTLLRTPVKKKTQFYFPKTPIEQLIWRIVHWSSLFIAPGFEDIQTLAKEGKIEAYIITSRYDCLRDDFKNWLRKMDAKKHFHATFHNVENLQPHAFKEKKIRELGLDYFIEDNWDIVKHINKTTKTKGIWISNALDKTIPYDLKYLSLKEAMAFLKTKVKS